MLAQCNQMDSEDRAWAFGTSPFFVVNDAHLAAMALEQRCEIVTYDRDFERFDGGSR